MRSLLVYFMFMMIMNIQKKCLMDNTKGCAWQETLCKIMSVSGFMLFTFFLIIWSLSHDFFFLIYFVKVRLQNGEKRSDLQWASWDDTVPDSPSPSVRSSIASFLSVFSYTQTNDEGNICKSRSIPPSPSPARSFSSIPRSRSDDANVGKAYVFILTFDLFLFILLCYNNNIVQ